MQTLALILAVVTLGVLYVVVPVVADVYARVRGTRTVTCPDTQSREEVSLDVARAALGAAFGASKFEIIGCSRWPEDRQCAQACVAQLAAPVRVTATTS